MEARIGREGHRFYANGASSLNAFGKKSFEWDLNDWNWDGDLFIASRLNAGPSDCRNKQLFPDAANGAPSNSSSSCSEEADFENAGRGKGEAEKRRRIVPVGDDRPYDGAGSLTLKLGGHAYPVVEGDLANGKKSKLEGANANRPMCQVEACGADLSNSKDYHRRHKVCEMHAKASTALVNNVMQRFCQQCSRFHLLQEFDEGKRSCRRRLAGHNRRRRKTHPDVTVSGASLIDERASSYLLITLLRILSNLHSESSEQSKDQDLLSHLLRSLANLAGSLDVRHLSGLLQASQVGNTAGPSSEVANASPSNYATLQELVRPLCSASKMACVTDGQGPHLKPTDNMASAAVTTVDLPSKRNDMVASPESAVERVTLKNFDLNSTYSDAQECGGHDNSATHVSKGTGSPNGPSWLQQDYHQSSPPQTSGHSDSTSAHSLSSSNGEAQSRTDRIVFKLFGKDPNDFPLVLRAQILDWLSHSPTDMESYIRPGCVVLTVYLRLRKTSWEELCCGLRSYLNRLLQNSSNDFWRTGWVYARVQHRVAFIHNGHVLLDRPLLHRCPDHCRIVCVTPIAVSHSAKVNFKVKGFNVARSSARLLCSFEGKYLAPESMQAIVEGTGGGGEQGELQCLSFSCSLPSATGRGFIEVEDHGLSNNFFPFIVAEEKVCSEICTLENVIDVGSYCDHLQEISDAKDARTQALEFLNELGWLLRRNQLRSRSQQMKSCANFFPLARFRWLMSFAMDREWCAVVKKLLDILFEGTVDVGGCSPIEFALSEDLLHGAVRRKCKPMVELLLRYAQDRTSKSGLDRFLFRPDRLGPSNLTPVHIAATIGDAESILDALTDDPGQLGIEAWKNARDSTGFTPEDYARARGYDSYVQLVQKKIDRQLNKGHVALDIPASLTAPGASNKLSDGSGSAKLAGFGIDKSKVRSIKQPYCNLCSQQLAYQKFGARSLLYRPAMLSMVGIAAVCVCVGILLKGPPQVFDVFQPFRWEMLSYGSI